MLREEAALSRAELARRVGVPASTLRNWEQDPGLPGLAVSLRLAVALGRSELHATENRQAPPVRCSGGFGADMLPSTAVGSTLSRLTMLPPATHAVRSSFRRPAPGVNSAR